MDENNFIDALVDFIEDYKKKNSKPKYFYKEITKEDFIKAVRNSLTNYMSSQGVEWVIGCGMEDINTFFHGLIKYHLDIRLHSYERYQLEEYKFDIIHVYHNKTKAIGYMTNRLDDITDYIIILAQELNVNIVDFTSDYNLATEKIRSELISTWTEIYKEVERTHEFTPHVIYEKEEEEDE